jgi:hypothetical protein
MLNVEMMHGGDWGSGRRMGSFFAEIDFISFSASNLVVFFVDLLAVVVDCVVFVRTVESSS